MLTLNARHVWNLLCCKWHTRGLHVCHLIIFFQNDFAVCWLMHLKRYCPRSDTDLTFSNDIVGIQVEKSFSCQKRGLFVYYVPLFHTISNQNQNSINTVLKLSTYYVLLPCRIPNRFVIKFCKTRCSTGRTCTPPYEHIN